jgi:hypothetical protein
VDWAGEVQYGWLRGKVDALNSPKDADAIVKTTSYFLHTRSRPDRAVIKEEWIERVINQPLREELQADGRIRRWARVPEMEGRALRVILLEDGETVHNAFFDRDFEE